jgi:hypothetical protein
VDLVVFAGVPYRRIEGVRFWTIVCALALEVGACGPAEPYVRYNGTKFGRPAKPVGAMEVFRASVPSGRFQDLGTVTVNCPSDAQNVFGSVQEFGGCDYDWAVRQACARAASNGGDGIHSIETAVNTSSRVVSLHASVFVRLPPLVSAQPATENRKPTVEERLRQLDKLKQDGLINQDEYDQRRQQILNDI